MTTLFSSWILVLWLWYYAVVYVMKMLQPKTKKLNCVASTIKEVTVSWSFAKSPITPRCPII